MATIVGFYESPFLVVMTTVLDKVIVPRGSSSGSTERFYVQPNNFKVKYLLINANYASTNKLNSE